MHTTPLKTLAVTAASAGLLLSGGLAAANAGMLPGAAQEGIQDMLGTIGVDVPGANEHAVSHADTRGSSDEAVPTTAGGSDHPESLPDAADFGQMIAELAKSTEGGPEKGKLISEAARGDHGPAQMPEHPTAGDHQAPAVGQAPATAGQAPEGSGQSGEHTPPVEAPNDGGTGTADGATTAQDDGASTHGTGTAADSSGGHSSAGSENRP